MSHFIDQCPTVSDLKTALFESDSWHTHYLDFVVPSVAPKALGASIRMARRADGSGKLWKIEGRFWDDPASGKRFVAICDTENRTGRLRFTWW